MRSPEPPNDATGTFAREMASLRSRIERLQVGLPEEEPSGELLIQDLEVAHEELRVAGEELRAQQEELDQVRELQRNKSWQHERLTSLLPVSVFSTDQKAVIGAANAASSALLRVRIDQLLGKPLLVFVDAADRGPLRQQLASAVRELVDFRRVVTLRPVNAEPLDVELQATVSADPLTGAAEVTWLVLAAQRAEEAPLSRAGTRAGLAHALVELTQLPLAAKGKRQVLADAARVCDRALGEGTEVSITLGPVAAPDVVATTGKSAQMVDGAQMVSDEGPCMEAWRTSREIWSENLHNDHRWRRLAEQLEGTAVDGVIALPFGIAQRPVGTFNIFLRSGERVGTELAQAAHLLSGALAAIVHELDTRLELENLTQDLRTALTSRATIDQAKGIIMARQGCSADEAFRHLVRVSSRTNTKLREVAAQIVTDTEGRPTP